MDWLALLGVVVVVVAIAAVTGLKPRGGRPVARSRMMGAARIALLVIVAIAVFFVLRGRG